MNVDDQPELLPSVHNPWTVANASESLCKARERLLRITEDMPCREAAAFLGVNAGTLQKWRNGDIETGLHYARADRIAIKNLGKHPADVWGQEWWKV
jgi:hypothetical protein